MADTAHAAQPDRRGSALLVVAAFAVVALVAGVGAGALVAVAGDAPVDDGGGDRHRIFNQGVVVEQGVGVVTIAPPPAIPSLPPPGEQPADPEAARAGVATAFADHWTGPNPRELKLAAVDDPSGLEAPMDQVRRSWPEATESTQVEILDVVFTAPDRASVLFQLHYEGAPSLGWRTGEARLVGDRWKLTRDTVCGVLSAAGAGCPPPATP